jgi:hypothetical protein
MFPQALPGALHLFGFERRDNFFVFELLLGEPGQPFFTLKRAFERGFRFAAFRGVDAGDSQMGIQAGVDLFEAFIARCLQQCLMEVAIRLLVFAERLFVVDRLAQQGQQFVELLGDGAGHTRDGQLRSEALEGAADFEGRLDIFDRQSGDEGSGAGPDFDEALGAETLNRVAYRGEGDAEFEGDVFDLQALAWLEAARENGIAQRLIHLIGSAFSGKSAKFHSVNPFIINFLESLCALRRSLQSQSGCRVTGGRPAGWRERRPG